MGYRVPPHSNDTETDKNPYIKKVLEVILKQKVKFVEAYSEIILVLLPSFVITNYLTWFRVIRKLKVLINLTLTLQN